MLPKKKSLFLFFLIFSLILISIYYVKFGAKDESKEKNLTPKVQIIERNVENFEKKLYFLAKLHSNKSINVISETDGIIEKKEYEIGDYVKKGQIIIQLTDTRKILELKEMEDLLEASKARMDEASSNYKNSLILYEKKIISSKEKESQWNNYRAFKSEYEAQKIRYKKVLWEFDNLTVRAPFNGYVNKYYFDIGQKISRGSSLFEFLDNKLLIGKANLSAMNAEDIRSSNKKIIIKNQKNKIIAKLLGIGRQMSNDSTSYKLEFQINNKQNHFIPGEVVEVEVVVDQYSNYISFPSSSIILEEDKYFIYIVKDEIVKKITVSPIQLNKELFIVPENQIPVSYKIIVNGQAKLETNDKVRISK